jgi:hypothetical protein
MTHVTGFMFMDNVEMCAIYVHKLIYVSDYKHKARNKKKLSLFSHSDIIYLMHFD